MTNPIYGPNGRSRYEKSVLASKKFVAFVITELTWKGVLIYLIHVMQTMCKQKDGSDVMGILESGELLGVMMTIVIVAGFMQAVYIGGQAALDKYVRVAEITMNGKHKTGSGGTGRGNVPVPPEFDEPEGEGPLDPPKEGENDA